MKPFQTHFLNSTNNLSLNRKLKKHFLFNLFFLTIFSLQSFSLFGNIVIHEIYAGSTVVLKNTGNQTVDVSTYWLCDFPEYLVLSDANLACGDLLLEPGATVAIDDFNTISGTDGEMGLYTSSDFASSTAMIDYVEWGSTGHVRSSVAVQAGIWTTGDFVPAFGPSQSLSFDGEGDSSSDWTAGTPIICASSELYSAKLSGTQQNPAILTTAKGSIQAELDGNTLIISGEFSGLLGDFDANIAGGAHVHNGLSGSNGGIELFLTTQISNDLRSGIFDPSENTFTLTNEQVDLLHKRKLYINIHTLAFPSGELRGQILANSEEYYHAILLGSNQTPAVQSNGCGGLMVELTGDQIIVSGSFGGLTSKIAVDLAGGAHIHEAPNGRNGALIFPLNLDINPDSSSANVYADQNTFSLTPEQKEILQSNGYYINIHSLNNLPGELRGQLVPISTILLRAELNGASQTTPVDTDAFGKLLVSFDGDETVTVSGSFSDLSSNLNVALAGGIHLHHGIAGTNGGIALILNSEVTADSTNGILSPNNNQFTIDTDVLNNLISRSIYVNVHSLNHPPGELRGQVLPLAKNYLATYLSGLNQTTSVISPARGGAVIEVNESSITLSGSFENLSDKMATDLAGGAHLHIAPIDQNGGIGFILNTEIDGDSLGGDFLAEQNTFEITAGIRDSLLNGEYYVNIHSLVNLPGELRGQVLREGNKFPTPFFDIISPDNNTNLVIDPNVENDIEILWESTVDEDDPNLVYTWQLSDDDQFNSTLLSIKVNTALNLTVTTTQLDSLLASIGVNLTGTPTTFYHRVLASDGSLSSSSEVFQIDISKANNDFDFVAILTGTQEVPSALTPAYGEVQATLNGNELIVQGYFEGLIGDFDANIAGGAHIHKAIAGRNGGLELLLTTNIANDLRSGTFEASENTFTLTTEQLEALNNRELYINIHTTAFPGGELRGQLLVNAEKYLQAILLGSNEIPSVNTEAYGNLVFGLEGNNLTVSGSFDELSGDIAIALAGGAHIHDAPNGRNGGVVFPLSLTADADNRGAIVEANNNVFTLTNEQVEKLIHDGYYINIHSEAILSGELRGQISTLSSATFRAQLTGVQEVPAINTNANGRILVNYDGNGKISISGTFNNLSNAINLPLAGGIHLHNGQAGRNGGIAFIINPELSLDSKSAVINPDENTFEVTPEQLDALFSRGLYVNVHSFNNPGGELRGQVLPLAKTYLGTSLSGLNEVPSAITPAKGNVQLEITNDQLIVTGGFSDLTGDFAADIAGGAHLHLSDATGNGGIAIFLETTVDADQRGGIFLPENNTFTLTAEQKENLLNGNIYVNIHSQAINSGELRGQILRDDNAFPEGGFEIISPTNNAQIVVDALVNSTIEILWEDTFDPNDDLVVYTWQLATSENFDQILVSAKVGSDLSFTTTSDVLENLLLNAGVPVGQNVTWFHRVLASDGSVSTASQALAVTILREGQACNAPEFIPGFTLIGDFADSRYYISNDVSRPIDAQITAESLGGYLATISSQLENDFIQANVPDLTYIGLNDFDTEGELVWFNGEPLTFNNINPCAFCEENSEEQDFVVIAPWDGSWSFSNFFSQRNFVLEIPCNTSMVSNAQSRTTLAAVLEDIQEVMIDKLMPNPATDQVNAILLSKVETDVELHIYDSRGSLVKVENTSLIEGANSIQIDISDLPEGFYQIHIPLKGRKSTSLRFIKIEE